MDIFNLFPKSISTYGSEMDRLFWIIVGITGFAFVVSLYVLFKPLITNHYRKVPRATYITGEGRKAFRWITIALVGLTLGDMYILYAEHDTWAKMESYQPQPDLEVAIIGRQWNYIFVYPGPDNKLFTPDDVRIDEQNSALHVPIAKNIVVNLQAKDVLHSFWVPEIRLKQDCIPGRTIKRWFNLTEYGKYELICAEICGVLHSKMRNYIVVESQADFDRYLQNLYYPAPPPQPTSPAEKAGTSK